VPPFGDRRARLLIVGLAPGLHGANATGRPFTGDHAGILLYETLYLLGIASASQSIDAKDDLRLNDCRITNAVKCLPPQNKPIGAEITACNPYLAAELKAVPSGGVILVLGRIAHQAVAKALSIKLASIPFGHGTEHDLPDGRRLVSSYHCSRYNTQTRRLTRAMFLKVMRRAAFIAYDSTHSLN
jgi:uracil-DNA glycosylase family 4